MDIEAVGPENADLVSALACAGLPADDLSEDGRHFFRFTNNGITVAFGGYELHGEHALLRSIVVLPDGREFTVNGRITSENGPTVLATLCVLGSATDRIGDFNPARYTREPSFA